MESAFRRATAGAFIFAATLAATIAVGGDASAQEATAADTAHMRHAMHAYFDGEKHEAWGFTGVGIGALGGGAAMFAASDGFYRGASYPIAAVGVVQLVVGVVLLARTDGQVADLDARLDRGKRAFLELEEPRMERVRAEFVWLGATELALLAGGLGLATFGGFRGDHTLSGIGTGIALQSAATLTFDVHAAARADAYSLAISTFSR